MNKLAQYLNQHIAGEVVTDPAVRESFATDNSVLKIVPQMVAYPRTTNDIRKILRFTSQLAQKGHQLPVTSRGGGTDTTGGAIGKGIVLSTASHMNRIFEYDGRQRLVRLQPGVSVNALTNALQLQGTAINALKYYPADATLGGVVAAGPSGSAPSVWIDQLEVALANGDLLQTKRLSKRELDRKKGEQGFEANIYRAIDGLIEDNKKLVGKELSGIGSLGYSFLYDVKHKDGSFDLTPLFVGSQGTLGVITEMILKAEYSSPTTSVVIAAFDDLPAARDVIDGVKKINPDRLEYIDGEIITKAQAVGKSLSTLKGMPEQPAVVLVAYLHDASERAQQKKVQKLSRVFKSYGGAVTSTDNLDTSEFSNIQSIPTLALSTDDAGAGVPLVEGAYVPLNQFEDFNDAVRELASKRRMSLPLFGLPLEGVWSTRPMLNLKNVSGKQAVIKIIDEYAALVARFGGHLVGSNGEGRLQSFSAYRQMDDHTMEVFEEVKKIFDPHGILNTGVKQPAEALEIARMLRDSYVPGHPDRLPRL